MSDNQELKDYIVFFQNLLRQEGEVVEVRIPGTEKGTISGYFDDFAALAEAVAPYNGNSSVFVILNPVNPALLARANNRLVPKAKHVTKDEDIVRRDWMVVNINPVRPADIPTSDEEHEAAIEMARQIREDLTSEGWPDPVLADSGNGACLLFYITLPNISDRFSHFFNILPVEISH